MRNIVLVLLLFFGACKSGSKSDTAKANSSEAAFDNKDYHTQSNADSVKANHLSLDISVDFSTKTLTGIAFWQLDPSRKTNTIIFDTYELLVDSVQNEKGQKLAYQVGKADSFLGAALSIELGKDSRGVKIFYRTTAQASALQWLAPEQTFGKKQPFLYTQSETIHARSWLPVQDGPGIRYTYDATVRVPQGLLALMSADNPQAKNAEGIYHFKMDKPVPAYLMALAVGDIAFSSIDERTGVYAEPVLLPKARKEFEDVGQMVKTAESLYGPYRWGRYDVLVLPSGFPIGGMENPKLTFCTPTIIAGDKSLVNLIAHELAHNWSGNLVTNETWNDFWLNEGFTVYFERRITEAMMGKDYTDMLWEIGYQDLVSTIKNMGEGSEDSHLRLNLKGRNPDDGLTDVPYEKGALLLRLIEQSVGREKMDTFLTKYFNDHAFKTMNTKDFVSYLNEQMLDANQEAKMKININEWLYNSGIPNNAPKAESQRFAAVNTVAESFIKGAPAQSLKTTNWSTFEWMHFLRQLYASGITHEQMSDLDAHFSLSKTQNSEKADLWYLLAIKHQYEPAYPAMRAFLYVTGREKFLTPLYREMMKTDAGKAMAKEIYLKARPNYHPLSQSIIDEIVR